jgi:ABC-type glutathione transport system ATPase component
VVGTDTAPAPAPAPGQDPTEAILTVEHYSGEFRWPDGRRRPVLHDVSFAVRRHTMTAVVGETGSGKTLAALATLGLSPHRFVHTGGAIRFEGTDVTRYGEREFRALRGHQIAMVFQDSRGALNPVFTIGTQLRDVCRLRRRMSRSDAQAVAEDLLERVRVPEPRRRMRQYPHELSGGTAQRVQLALALARQPALLILDEPTTGLDVTIQAEILDLVVDLTREQGMTTCMITHDLGVVAETCDDVVVMYAGEVRETGSCEQIMTAPADGYTRDLLAASRAEVATR